VKDANKRLRDDKEVELDLFIRNDACLCRMYLSMMAIEDVVIIKVAMYIMQCIAVVFLLENEF